MPKLITFLTPQAGNWYIITKFKKEIDSFIYDPEDPKKNPSSLKILGWPYGRGLIKLQFTEIVSDLETAKTAKVTDPKSPAFGNKKYVSYRTFATSNIIIGTRQELVDHLNKIESHPAVVEITTSDGASIETIVSISFKILDPIATKNVEDFLVYGTNFVIEVLRLWGNKHTFKENRGIDTNDDMTKDDDVWDKINHLNETEFKQNGFSVCKVAVIAIAVGERSKEFLNSEQKIGEEQNKSAAAVFTQEIDLRKNETQKALNKTKLELIRGEADIQIDLIEKTAESLAKQNKAWGEGGLKTLIINGDKQNQVQTIQVADTTAN